MRLPKRGQKGFTLIELLIVVAILGVLAAVVIPNVGQFIGAGTEEARKTEFADIQTAVHSMMVDNQIAKIPAPAFAYAAGAATNDLTRFPDETSSDAVPSALKPGKVTDPEGFDYNFTAEPPTGDLEGYRLYGHDITGSGTGAPPVANPDTADVSYVAMKTSTYYYTCEIDGTVRQFADAGLVTEYTY